MVHVSVWKCGSYWRKRLGSRSAEACNDSDLHFSNNTTSMQNANQKLENVPSVPISPISRPSLRLSPSLRGPGQSMHGVGRLPWAYGRPDDPQRLTGTDVCVTKDGKLAALYVFIDPPSQK